MIFFLFMIALKSAALFSMEDDDKSTETYSSNSSDNMSDISDDGDVENLNETIDELNLSLKNAKNRLEELKANNHITLEIECKIEILEKRRSNCKKMLQLLEKNFKN